MKKLLGILLLSITLVLSFTVKTKAQKYPQSGTFTSVSQLKVYSQYVYPPKSYTYVTDGQKIQRVMNGIMDILTLGTPDSTSGTKKTVTINFASTPANTTLDSVVTMMGAAVGDDIHLTASIWPANYNWTAFVSAANTIHIRGSNISASAIDPGSTVFILKNYKQ